MIDGVDSVAPRARSSGLVVRELEDEVLIFDVDRDKAHCLNRTAGLVWKQCDGRTSVEEIRQVLEEELETPVNAEIIWRALSDLDRDHLLDEEVSQPAAMARMSRRELMKRAGITVAIPVIASLAIPSVALATGSPGSCGTTCGGLNSACTHGTCMGSCGTPGNACSVGTICCVPKNIPPPNGCTRGAQNCLCCSGICKADNGGQCAA
jgi:Coenzyme PQQ synthesis protein D (PqqD)